MSESECEVIPVPMIEGVKTHEDNHHVPPGWIELPMGARCHLWFAWYPVRLGMWPQLQCDGWAWWRPVLEWRCPSTLRDRWLLWSTPDAWYESADDVAANITAKLRRWNAAPSVYNP